MKRPLTRYWVYTSLFCVMMLLSASRQLTAASDAVVLMQILHLPFCLLLFLGAAKLLGIPALLIPGYWT